MVQINFAQKQVNAKIVYYGPGMSGKTTNLEVVHQRAPDQNRGDLTSISTDGDRTLFFDFMPLDLGTVAGMRTSFQIYTVPGQVYYNSTRKLVLQGVDGVVFVADSSASMMEENLESLRNLEENLNEYGKSLASMPHIIQYNKRDLPDALPVEELQRTLNVHGVQAFEAVANTGQGVFPTLKALAASVLDTIHTGARKPAAQPAAAPAPAAPASPAVAAGQAAGSFGTHSAPPPTQAPQTAMPPAPPAPGAQVQAAQPAAPPPTPAAQPNLMMNQAPVPPVDPMASTSFQPAPTGVAGVAPHNPAPGLGQTGFRGGPMAPQPGAPQQAAAPGTAGLQMAAPMAQARQQQAQTATPGGLMRPEPQRQPQPAAPTPQAAPTPSNLEGTRFRPRTARPEAMPTPAGKPAGNKYTLLFLALGAAVVGVLGKVVLSFF